MSAQTLSLPAARRFDLDWMRVIAILVVFVFHSFRFFSTENWHVSNAIRYQAVTDGLAFLSTWMMPFIFVVSGASAFFAVGKGSAAGTAWKFVKDKVLRLLVPLLFNIFTLCILQVYLERITHSQFSGSIFAFLPLYFRGIYGIDNGGNFALVGMHLWYLAVLFLFSLVMLPVFMLLKSRIGGRILDGFTKVVAFPGVIYLLVLIIVTLWKLINPDGILGFDKFAWNLGIYLSFYIFGFVIFSSERLLASIGRQRWISLALAIGMTVWYIVTNGDQDDLVSMAWILTFLGFGLRYLNVNKPALHYAGEAVLPFYILHQTVLLCVGYFVMPLAISDPLKWAITAIGSLAIILGAYEFLVRRSGVLRFLFGMRPLRKTLQPATRTISPENPILQGR